MCIRDRVETGRDLVTLVTCHPYGINTHRLLVQGTRIPYEVALAQQVQEDVPQETSAVSYTHLDVYKRQPVYPGICAGKTKQ